MAKTLFDKIWERHLVKSISQGPDVLYVDTHLIHEVTSPQAFEQLKEKNRKVFRPQQTFATPDHNVPTKNQHLPIGDALSANQVNTLQKNCSEHNIRIFPLGDKRQGIVHVVGPELGITQPGHVIVCGDSHTSTHGAFGTIAFGIGTSQVAQVLATQCLLMEKPKNMRITVSGTLNPFVTAKDIALHVIRSLGTSGGTEHFVEYQGDAIRSLSMEGRMTLCNMSIEMGARGGMIAPDETTFAYLQGRSFSPAKEKWESAIEKWKQLFTDEDAIFDKEIQINAADIFPLITYGTNPAMALQLSENIPAKDDELNEASFERALNYMGWNRGEAVSGKKIDYVFIGSCTNGRIEDLRMMAMAVKGKRKAEHVTAYIVPGSRQVEAQARMEGLDLVLAEAGFNLREPGCSACLAMNEDKVPAGMYCVSTSNRNFEGRQGNGARTILASPFIAAICAIEGKIPTTEILMSYGKN